MMFLSPIWLWLLAPWGVVALWLMWGRGKQQSVPFLDLWRGAVSKPSMTRLFRPPPLAIVALLAGMLLAIVGAARPVVGASDRTRVTVVLDRGITMSAGQRRAEALREAREVLERSFPTAGVELVMVPAAKAQATFPGDAAEAAATAIETGEMLGPAVANALARSDVVLVLSDQAVQRDDRIVQITPKEQVENVGIVRFAIREQPAAAAMVTVRNDSARTVATLIVESIAREIDLPPLGQEKNYFVNLDRLSTTPMARLDVDDDLAADNAAWLARQRDFPRVEIQSTVPLEVQRVVRAYQTARPAGQSGAAIIVTSSPAGLSPKQPTVIVPATAGTAPIAGPIDVRAHAITADVDWRTAQLRPVDRSIDGDWTALLSVNGKPLLAIMETPVRRVWVNFDAAEFARTAEFVVMWTRMLDWLGEAGGETFMARTVNDLTDELEPVDSSKVQMPGLYRTRDGAIAAFNAPAPRFDTSAPAPNSTAAIPRDPSRAGGVNVLPYIVLAAIACILVAAYAWPRRRLTPVFAPRTV